MSATASSVALAAPPTIGVWCGRSKPSAFSASVASAITALTLSVLPARNAIETSFCAHSSGSVKCSIVSSIVESSSTPHKPSEHSSRRSPARAVRIEMSGRASMSKSPSTRITTLRCGWLRASDWLMRLVSMRCCT